MMSADLDKEKQALFLKFLEHVSDLLPTLRNDFLRSDPILVKFLIARGYNLHKAVEMYRKCWEWRRANHVEAILERPFCHALDPFYKLLLPGFDKLGHPIFMTQAGQWDVLSLLESKGAKTEIATIVTQFLEKGLDICRIVSQNGKTITKGFVIVDCADFDYTLLANPKVITTGLSLLRECSQMAINYYPECVYKVVVLNITPMFQLVWTMLKPLFPRATLEKVAIFGNNPDRWKNYLLEHIDPNALPSQFGGSDTTGLLDRYELDKEFIPRKELELLPPEDLIECFVEPRKSFSVDITTKAGDTLVWNFKTEMLDIGFKVECDDGCVIIEPCRVDAHKFTQKGRLHCPCDAKYTFTWDNSYSYMSGKKLFYAVIVRNIS